MDTCRLCLKSRKRLLSLNTTKDRIKYSDMVHAISNIIKINAAADEKLCIACCRKLEDAYNFKIMIESCDAEFQNLTNTKRITFSTLEDIKVKIKIPNIDTKILKPDLIEKLNCDDLEFKYNETLLKRKRSKKPLTVLEFLNSFKEESDNSFDGYEVDVEYEPDEDCTDLDYVPRKEKVKQNKTKLESETTKRTVKVSKENKEKIFVDKPIKPKLFANIRLKLDFFKRPKNNVAAPIRKEAPRQICPYCGKLLADIKSHILIHSGEKKFKCDICQKAFFKLSSLQTHKAKVHGPKTIKCDECVAVFASRGDLKSHKRSHSDVKNFICEICSRAFKVRSKLLRHKALIHNIGVKEYKCEQCDKTCKTSETLRHHMRVHTGERPYKCEMCSQPYSYKHDFNRHCFKKHGVLFKRRRVYVMNEEVLMKERALMKNLMLRINGVIKEDVPLNPFEGHQAAQAYTLITKALAQGQIPLDFEF